MKPKISFPQLFEGIRSAAEPVAKSPIAIGVLVEPYTAEAKAWIQDSRDEYWVVYDEINAGLNKPLLQTMRDEVLRGEEKDRRDFQMGYIEYADIKHDAMIDCFLSSAAIYELLEAVDSAMEGAISLGRKFCRMTVCVFCESGAKEARHVQAMVSTYIRNTLADSDFGTNTNVQG